MYTNFEELFSAKRKALGKTLREFCRENGFDAGNISKIERGILTPPQSKEKDCNMLQRLASRKDLMIGWNFVI